jgi:4-hydroxybenzoyl-CoA reductase subunit beta
MLLPPHEFAKPRTLRECLTVLRESGDGVKLLAGGTDVVFNMRGRLFQPEVLLSIRELAELRQVERLADGSLSIGAACRLTDLERHPQLQTLPALVAAIRAVASRHVRNMGTLGGNLNLDTRCWYTNQTAEWRDAKGDCLKTGEPVCHAIKSSAICVAINASDTAPALLALDATAVLVSADGEREVPLRDFYTADGLAHTVRRSDEIMARIIVPPTTDRMTFMKETARKGNDFAYATIAATADGHATECSRATIVLGSLTTRPVMLGRTAAAVVAGGLDDASIDSAAELVRDELGALTNLYTPAAYKGRIARSLVREALRELRGINAG